MYVYIHTYIYIHVHMYVQILDFMVLVNLKNISFAITLMYKIIWNSI